MRQAFRSPVVSLSARHRASCALLGALLLALAACSDDSDEPLVAPIDLPTANDDRCEILDADNCLMPWPSAVFTVADDSMPSGRRVDLAIDSMPVNKQGVPVNPAEWNRNDGFSPSQMLVSGLIWATGTA